MTISVPSPTRCARLVHQYSGPIERVQLREVPTDWLIVSIGRGVDLAATVEKLQRAVVRRGYVVDEGATFEDWRRGKWGG